MSEVVNGKRLTGDTLKKWHRLKAYGAERLVSVAGVSFKKDALSRVLADGIATLDFVPEPENQYDPNARRVELNGVHVGYLPWNSPAVTRAQVLVAEAEKMHYVWLAVA